MNSMNAEPIQQHDQCSKCEYWSDDCEPDGVGDMICANCRDDINENHLPEVDELHGVTPYDIKSLARDIIRKELECRSGTAANLLAEVEKLCDGRIAEWKSRHARETL